MRCYYLPLAHQRVVCFLLTNRVPLCHLPFQADPLYPQLMDDAKETETFNINLNATHVRFFCFCVCVCV